MHLRITKRWIPMYLAQAQSLISSYQKTISTVIGLLKVYTSHRIAASSPADFFRYHIPPPSRTRLHQAARPQNLIDHRPVSPISSSQRSRATKTGIRHSLSPSEVVTCIKTISLEVSEHTHERQNLVCVGTALLRGPDLPSIGNIYIIAVIPVVPEPNHPETGRALKLVAKEEVKGAVTSLSGIGTQGFLLVAQGQKCMVRGLKEDGSLLPVAFLDMQCYVSVVRELEGTGLCLMGDAVKGIWFCGYSV